ncbi:MAG: hypothetical protein CNE98_06780 [Bacteroidetes bacterium MED-G17]|nr:MAG: hypothetical protein CBB99_06805 [Bacteroidetes bacterium TMED39]PDH51745.1 MAG: hypothetical protein CNE98_06780 [Bacteroidetes bacterium MED-G17]CAI8293562.1 MAG: Uncharacterised protein [Bacteroidetes bacterium MED-G17]|tara:strand:+ start:62398 stop:63255 length:858 start_codon:yes stop_codon:yes gene_type:complete
MQLKKSLFCLFVANFALWSTSQAQIEIPKKSPYSKIFQKVGLTDISIEYSRPSAKGRKVFGHLVPFGDLWRTGANASTKIKFNKQVKIAGQELAAGQYALYTIPNEQEWEIILHKNTTLWGTGGKDYKEEENVLRFSVTPQKILDFTETFQITIEDISDEQCLIVLSWEKTRINFKINLETDLDVLKSIDKAMSGVQANTYYSAASYYLEKKLDLDKALSWINLALAQKNSYWMLRKKAQILKAKNKIDQAIKVNTEALILAEKAGKEMYMNSIKKEITTWKKAE